MGSPFFVHHKCFWQAGKIAVIGAEHRDCAIFIIGLRLTTEMSNGKAMMKSRLEASYAPGFSFADSGSRVGIIDKPARSCNIFCNIYIL